LYHSTWLKSNKEEEKKTANMSNCPRVGPSKGSVDPMFTEQGRRFRIELKARFTDYGLGCRFWDSRFGVWGLELRVQGSDLRVEGLGLGFHPFSRSIAERSDVRSSESTGCPERSRSAVSTRPAPDSLAAHFKEDSHSRLIDFGITQL